MPMLKLSPAIALCAILISGTAQAASLTIDTVVGAWSNANPAGTPVDNSTGPGDDTVSARWGQPTTSGGSQSGYDFSGASSFSAVDNVDFVLGTFKHLNFPITGSALTSIQLAVAVSVAGYASPIVSNFTFSHNETSNTPSACLPGSVSVCDDVVTATLNLASSDSFSLGGTDYVFTISGFEYNGSIFDSFMTQEGMENTASLIGKFVAKDSLSAVPLPATGLLLMGGFGGLAMLRRRRRDGRPAA